MTKTANPAHDDNIRAMVSYFESGIKTAPLKIGIELEYTIVNDDYSPVSYYDDGGVKQLLDELSDDYPKPIYDDKNNLLGLEAPEKVITLEPAAQVELAVGPFENLIDAQTCLEQFDQQLDAILKPINRLALTYGYHPSACAADLNLIPKLRYELMDAYFADISDYSRCMMRGSASTQISIDYTSAENCIKKMRCACALAPLISLMCDNAPKFEGDNSPHHMMRTEIWKYCDPNRCGTIPHIMDENFTLQNYAEYILGTPAILAPTPHNTQFCADNRTFDEIYAERVMSHKDIEHALSMNFADVRLKDHIEIRPADAMPIPFVMAYAAFIKGLFYNETGIDSLLVQFSDVDETDINTGKENLMIHGYEGKLYRRDVGELADEIMCLAQSGLNESDRKLLKPLANLVAQRTTLSQLSLSIDNKFSIS